MKKGQTLYELVRKVSERDYQKMLAEVGNGYITKREFYRGWKEKEDYLTKEEKRLKKEAIAEELTK